jgi:GTP-binding protein
MMNIRNLAIIAHVDHGKTTLIDGMLKQTHTFRDNQAEMSQDAILDSNDLEREKGITILAKNTMVLYKDTKINIIDTPGHADFGGEVERVISMADGALLIVDSAEGPLPQTRFVLEQAFKHHLKMIVVINKIDKKHAEPQRALQQTEELFLELADNDEQLNFPVIYAAGREGKAWTSLPENKDEAVNDPSVDLTALFEQILESIPAPQVENDKPFMMQVSNLDFDNFKGIFAIGKITQGNLKKNDPLVIFEDDKKVGTSRAVNVFTSKGLGRVEADFVQAGDIVAITGIDKIKIGQTLVAPGIEAGLPMIKIAQPTLKVQIAPNSSPFAGRDGEFVTSRQLEERLNREKKVNLGLKITVNMDGSGFMVAGRGELHLAVLIETMRREGYEMQVSKPEVIFKEIDGKTCEPVEELNIDIKQDFIGIITEELGRRHGQLQESSTNKKGVAHMVYKISSRNLLGFRSEILTKTRGNGLFSTRFLGYFPVMTRAAKLRNGVLIATEAGKSTAYAIESVQQRGVPFIKPGINVYEGMLIGLGKTSEDIDMNACKSKQMTNFRSNADVSVRLDTPIELSLEQSIDFIEEDELLEVTPQNLRLRKKYLSRKERMKKINS